MTTTPLSPVRLSGQLAPTLSRWLWLVKWVLVIPHVFLLFFLSIAALVTTIISGFAILFIGRYPRPLFDFAVGVLRWGWRVSFYSYSALGVDKYPPFTLARTDYPADFDIAYPERLNRGLVLVKWWLLAIPHYIVLALIAGGSYGWGGYGRNDVDYGSAEEWRDGWHEAWKTGNWDAVDWTAASWHSADWGWAGSTPGLLGILVFFAGVILLFTARYPQALFDFVMGLNRWVYRVYAYVFLLTDKYPPFRLDQGADEPGPEQTPEPATTKAKPKA